MKRLLLTIPLLTGCAVLEEQGERQHAAELANNRAEVEYAERQICEQIRAAVLLEKYEKTFQLWAHFCGYE